MAAKLHIALCTCNLQIASHAMLDFAFEIALEIAHAFEIACAKKFAHAKLHLQFQLHVQIFERKKTACMCNLEDSKMLRL